MTAVATRKGIGKPAATKAEKGRAAVMAAAHPNTLADLQQPFAKPGSTSAPAAPVLDMSRYVEAPPNAFKTLTSLREMGYDSVASVADLVDNSIDAGATRVAVRVKAAGKAGVRGEGDTGITIDVVDNGKGMNAATLNQAMRLGSDTDHVASDLGKYGMGLVTASLGMARSVYVLTRQGKGQAYEATLDIDDVARHNKFLIALAPVADHARVAKEIPDGGTAVRLTKIDRIDDANVARFAATLRTRFAQIYREFLGRGVKISVNDKNVKPADPLMREHPETRVTLDESFAIDGHKFHVVAVDLPDLGIAGNADADIDAHNSGVYVMRNGRQITGAETFGLYRRHHAYSGFRAELSFGKDADALFHVDIMKQSITPDERLLKKLADALGKPIAESGKQGRTRREAPVNAAALKLDYAADVLNAAVARAVPATTAPPVQAPAAKDKAADKPTGATPNLTTGEPPTPSAKLVKAVSGKTTPTSAPPAPPAPAKREPAVKWGQEAMPPAMLYKAVEKDGQWLITVNSDHPISKLVAEARHKAATSILTYFIFALASAAKGTKGGGEVAEKIGATLASVLGTPEA